MTGVREEDREMDPVCLGCGDSFTVDYGCENDGWCHPCAHDRVASLESLLLRARSLIDTLNGNIQGRTGAVLRDPVTYNICQAMVADIDAVIRTEEL